jgi:vacuolar-type H+-ATPase subunit H
MEMNKILSLGGRLNKLIERTESEAEAIITEAKTKADEIIGVAKNESAQRLQRAQRRSGLEEFLNEAEMEAKIVAEKTLLDYSKNVEEIKSVPETKIKEASKLILKEVLYYGPRES